MMFDTSCIAHTAGGNYDFAVFVEVDRSGIVAGYGGFQSRECQWVDPFVNQIHGFFIKAVILVFAKNGRCFIGKRTVYVNFEVAMAFYSVFCFDLADKVEHFLCTSYCKGRYDQVAAPVKSSLDHFCK